MVTRSDDARSVASGRLRKPRPPAAAPVQANRPGRPGTSAGVPAGALEQAATRNPRRVPSGAWNKQSARQARSAGLDQASLGGVGAGAGTSEFDMLYNMISEMGGGDMSGDIAAGYDAQRQALLDMIPLMQESGELANRNIGEYFGFAQSVAEEGRGAVGDIYGSAQQGVGDIYDQLGEQLRGMPGEVTDIAAQAAGGAVRGDVAGQSAAAMAPFAAAGESARAGATENLTRRSAAAENYMQQLAAANPAEAAQRQSDVEQRLAMASAQVQQQAGMIEAEKQRALAQYGQDSSVDQFNRMLDVMQMELALDRHGLDRDRFDLEREMFQQGGGAPDTAEMLRQVNLDEKTDPLRVGGQRGASMVLQGTSPATRQAFNQIIQDVQLNPMRSPELGTGPKSDQEFLAEAMSLMAAYTDPSSEGEEMREELGVPFLAADQRALQEAIRAMWGGG